MVKPQSTEIKEFAMAFDKALEDKDIDKVIESFTDDCEIELLSTKLQGKQGAKKWYKWLYTHIAKLKLIPVTIMTENNVFFEEFIVRATYPDGKQAQSKQAEVLVFEGQKIKSLRMYFDRIDFSSSMAKDFISKTIIKQIIKKSLEGLS
jgi:ketosteroid isomerase-like protein